MFLIYINLSILLSYLCLFTCTINALIVTAYSWRDMGISEYKKRNRKLIKP